jgi:hypothetical protein
LVKFEARPEERVSSLPLALRGQEQREPKASQPQAQLAQVLLVLARQEH